MAPHVVMVVENLTVPRDRRVWDEATTLRDAGYEVTVICPVGPGFQDAEERREGVRILRHPLPSGSASKAGYVREYWHALRWERRLLRRVWRQAPFQVIHLANPPDLLFLLAWPYRRRGVRVVFDHHDPSPELYEAKFGRRGPVHAVLRLAEWLTFRSVDRIISTNESMRQLAIRRGNVDPAVVHVVRNGPDPDEFAPRSADEEVRRGRSFLVAWLGNMGEQAGLGDLVRAATHIIREQGRDDIHFMLIGDGPARSRVEALARDQGVEDHLEFTGPLYGDRLIRHISSCDAGLLTLPGSPYGQQTTPVKTMEYMAVGIPVVQYDLLESRRTAGDAAAYARPNDPVHLAEKILWLADHPEERRELGARGRERVVRSLAWRHQAALLLAAYRELTGVD